MNIWIAVILTLGAVSIPVALTGVVTDHDGTIRAGLAMLTTAITMAAATGLVYLWASVIGGTA